jgi:hypothetical protein
MRPEFTGPKPRAHNMTGASKRKIMIGVGVLALVLGAAVAIMTASGSSKGPIKPNSHHLVGIRDIRDSGDLALAADYLGVSRAQLRHELSSGSTLADIANTTSGHSASGLTDALFAAKAARLNEAVSTGKLSKAKQASRLAKLPESLAVEIYRQHTVNAGSADVATAAGYLGLTTKQIRDAQRSGRSLAQIAAATAGKSATGLIHALVGAKSAALADAVRAGTLNRSEQSKMNAELERRVAAEVDHVPPKRVSRG